VPWERAGSWDQDEVKGGAAGGVRGLAASEAVVREWDRGEQLESLG
jgi:hypothetical protein